MIDVFVDELDLAQLGFYRVAPEVTGRPAYHPSVLLKLYIYGYLNRVQSSRRLERETGRNVEVMWLTGRLVPDHKTIADFRKDNGEAIGRVCARFIVLCRALLVKIKRDLENQIRGLLKNLGLVIGQAKMNVFSVRAAELAEARPELAAAVEPLLKAREAVGRQIADLDRKVMRLARNDAQVRRFMTAPGVGPITALCFLATIDDPTRFKRSRSVGAYAGLTTRRYASGEIDWTGRISKCGDKMLRSYLYEAANVLLTRVAKWSALKAWGVRLAKRSGLRKAKVAVARKLAVILHRMWIEGTEFNWSSKEAANQPA